ncbi:methionine--tRNA ligase [Streptacidiphilus sp. PB12-B1b]|uniref:methionine--tRNA ligase n=1 Tax=Streptacidiphilus sp. PB12-B1b TaxID=2705012 RepID=UPI0015FB6C56|nr:methionine--tRNA ligase [Streptacidiphilus sp. PB12-B1b]QMU78210.1 methionine--tRNA ligase [Streptacidiphilus sp. PB12-B1b]
MSAAAFISTTIPYVNARPHLGHALEYVQTDAFARHARYRKDVFFLSGSDENSLKNVLAAEREGVTTRELVDRNVQYFEKLLAALSIDTSDFIRTSVSAKHIAGATEFWRRMDERGDIYTKDYEGLYCVGCEQFYSPAELVDGKCPDHLTVPERVKEHNHFFRLSRYGDQLLEELTAGRLKIYPESRLNEVVGFLRSGLEDISISRSVERARGWGIPVPKDEDQVMYVWIDALTNYINALGWNDDSDEYRRFWAEADQRAHVVGKGVLRFHAVYWPAMLLSAGLPLPTEVVVHGYITTGGQKLSKSLGNAIDPMDLLEQYGQDALRYLLLADFSPFGDGDFSEERLVVRYNTDLANALGNLLSRITAMTVRYRDGVVPASGPLGAPEEALLEQGLASTRESDAAMERYDHREALARIWDLVRRANAYVDERAPWHLAKAAEQGDQQAAQDLDTVLHHGYRVLQRLGVLLRPFIPNAAERMLLALAEDPEALIADLAVDPAGRSVEKAPPLFPKLELA